MNEYGTVRGVLAIAGVDVIVKKHITFTYTVYEPHVFCVNWNKISPLVFLLALDTTIDQKHANIINLWTIWRKLIIILYQSFYFVIYIDHRRKDIYKKGVFITSGSEFRNAVS